MKGLRDYLSFSEMDKIIIENSLGYDYQLTEDEIYASIEDTIIKEGFWSWLGDLITKLFTDSSPETKEYGDRMFTHFNNEYGDLTKKTTSELLKEKNADAFLSKLEKARGELLEDGEMSKEHSYSWAALVCKTKMKMFKDAEKMADFKKVETAYENYKKKAGKLYDNDETAIEKIEPQQSVDGPKVKAPTKEIGRAVQKASKNHTDTIALFCTTMNSTQDQMLRVIYDVIDKYFPDDVKKLSDATTAFAIMAIFTGAYMTSGMSNRDNIIHFLGGLLRVEAEKNFEEPPTNTNK